MVAAPPRGSVRRPERVAPSPRGSSLRPERVARFFLYTLLVAQLGELVVAPLYVALTAPEELRTTLADGWPLTLRTFGCDAEISARLQTLVGPPGGTPWVIAHTDYQRLKFFADELQPWDLTGINDRDIAHRPVAGPVRWGKFSYAAALQRRPDLWILGHRVEPHDAPAEPLSRHALYDVLQDAARAERYFGYAVEPPAIAPISQLYVAASLPVCGGYFNFFLRRDHARLAVQRGVLVEKF